MHQLRLQADPFLGGDFRDDFGGGSPVKVVQHIQDRIGNVQRFQITVSAQARSLVADADQLQRTYLQARRGLKGGDALVGLASQCGQQVGLRSANVQDVLPGERGDQPAAGTIELKLAAEPLPPLLPTSGRPIGEDCQP